jgi:hypothetical protein
MKVRKQLKTLTLATLVVLYFSIAASSDELCQIIPEELLNFAKEKGFEQVLDFYRNRPGMLNPPYLYGYLPGREENSAVFWCQRTERGKKSYFLVFMFKDKSQKLCECPDVIKWQNFPKGLSIYKPTNETLENFVYVKDLKKRGPRDARLTHNGILCEYDGVSEIFYCHNGEWLVWMRD